MRTGVFAHRGASAVAPESTASAITEAVRCRADMIELDVQLSADGRLVIFHDDRLDRTTNGRGLLSRAPYRELARLDAGAWFHPRFAGQRILLASQVLALVPKSIRINFELKRTPRKQLLIETIRRLLTRHHAWSRVLISSFDKDLILPLKGTAARLALITRHQADAGLSLAIEAKLNAWHPFHMLLNSARLQRAHAAGLRVHAWTVDTAAQAEKLIRLGVDGLFTNDPLRLRSRLRMNRP